MFSVVSKERVAIAIARIRAAAVPALSVKYDDRSGRCCWLYFVLDVKVFRGRDQPAAMRAWYDARAANFRREIVEHPHGIHHDGRTHVEHSAGDVAVEILIAVAGAYNARVEAAQDQRSVEKMFENRKHAGMVYARMKYAVEHG